MAKRFKIEGLRELAVKDGVSFDDLIAATASSDDPEAERRLRLWLADVAAHVLHIFEKERPADMRPREAVVATRQYAHGEIDAAARNAAWAAARAAARAAAKDAAWAAAWAAARAAAWDAGWDVARDAAWDAARADEEQWQLDRLVYWFSEENPQDLPLPKTQTSRAVA